MYCGNNIQDPYASAHKNSYKWESLWQKTHALEILLKSKLERQNSSQRSATFQNHLKMTKLVIKIDGDNEIGLIVQLLHKLVVHVDQNSLLCTLQHTL